MDLYGFVGNNGIDRWDKLGNAYFNFDFTQNLQIGGCIPIPSIPGASLCVTGGYTVTIDGCCKDGKKKKKIAISGDINFYAQLEPLGFSGKFTFSYTKGSEILNGGTEQPCPAESNAEVTGSIFVGFNAGVVNGQCTMQIPSGEWSCSVSAQLGYQVDVYGGGSINVSKTLIRD